MQHATGIDLTPAVAQMPYADAINYAVGDMLATPWPDWPLEPVMEDTPEPTPEPALSLNAVNPLPLTQIEGLGLCP